MEEEDSILLSEKYGLNPSIEVCLLCGKDIRSILNGKLPKDIEAPKEVCLCNICDECAERYKQEHKRILLEVSEEGPTGKYYEISEENINKKVLNETDSIVLFIKEGTIC